MGKSSAAENTDNYESAQTEAHAEAVPRWEPRELASEYAAAGRRHQGIDIPFLVITLVILLIGVIMVLSASFARAYYSSGEPMKVFLRQLIFAVSGTAMMLLVSRIKISVMSRWSMMLLLVSVIMLVLVLFIGIKLNGARRWLGIGGENSSFTFQPSEIAKVAVILSFAQLMCKFGGKKIKTLKYGVLPFAAITAVVVLLLAKEPHLSAVIIVTTLAAIMMFAGGTRLRWFLIGGAIVVAAAGIFLLVNLWGAAPDNAGADTTEQLSQVDWSGKFGYAGKRIDAWLNPDADPLGDGFQIRQSLLAVGSGGLLGQGLGQSRQKYLYLPEEHNDYIFAVVCEELGFIGAILVLLLFTLLIIRGYWLAMHAKDKYSSLITIGITSLLAILVFLNVAVVTNLLPATGISLPFFSSGGTALWIQMIQMGIILAVSREIPAYKSEEQ